MSETSTLIGYAGRTINRDELALVPTPPATATHHPYLTMKSSRRSQRRLDSATSVSFMTSTQYHRTA